MGILESVEGTAAVDNSRKAAVVGIYVYVKAATHSGVPLQYHSKPL